MEKYCLEKHRKLIESIRLFGSITIGLLMAFQWLNIIAGFIIVLVLGVIDQIFVKPKLNPKNKKKE